MALRLLVFIVALVACHAKPMWFVENDLFPGTLYYRDGRAFEFEPPSIAYGLGYGFSSNIGGIKQSNSFGTAYEFGGGRASGLGSAGTDGNTFAQGTGIADLAPSRPSIYRATYPYNYYPYNTYRRNNNNYAPTQSTGQGQGTSIAQNTPYGSSAAAVQQSGVASAQTLKGYGPYGATLSSAQTVGLGTAIASTTGDHGTAFSTTQSRDGYNTAVAASQNIGGFRASSAHTVQQDGRGAQQSFASTIDGPGIQAANAH